MTMLTLMYKLVSKWKENDERFYMYSIKLTMVQRDSVWKIKKFEIQHFLIKIKSDRTV